MSLLAVKLTDKNIYLNSAGKSYRVGTQGETSDGRLFRYALEGGNAIVANALCQSRAFNDSTWATIVIATTTKPGDTKISVADQSDTWARDELENGFLVCETDPNSNSGPNCWRIHGNDAVSGTANFNIYLAEGATIGQVLVASTDKMIYSPSLYSKVIVSPVGAATGMAVGVTMIAVSADRYCWLQTSGVCGVLIDDGGTNAAVGLGLIADETTAGNVESVASNDKLQVVGQTLTVQGLTSADVIPVFLTIE